MTTAHSATPAPVDAGSSSGSLRMRAHARLGTELRTGRRGPQSHIATLRSDPPLALRRSNAKGPEPDLTGDVVRVSLAASAAGPVGGDRYRFDIHVGAGSTVILSEVSATLLLPGNDGAQSRTDVSIQVEAGGTLAWLPEPVIAAHRCDHINNVDVDLAATARLFMREELLLGRHHEPAGRLRQHVRVRRSGRPVYSQDVDLGSCAWATPGVGAGFRAAGSVLVVDPGWQDDPPPPRDLPGQAALMPLADAAILISALAGDNLELRQDLDAGLALLGSPWAPRSTR